MTPELLKPAKRLCAAPATALVLMGTFGAAALAAVTWPRQAGGLVASPPFLALGAAALAVLARALYVLAVARLRAPAGAARWGTWGFHLGLALLIASGFATWAFQARGFVQLMEGEDFPGSQEGFLELRKGRFAGRLDLPFGLRLGRLRHERWSDGAMRALESDVVVEDAGAPRLRTLSVNHPLRLGDVRVYQSSHCGYAVSLAFQARGRAPAVTHFLLDAPARPGPPAVGGAEFPTTPYVVRLWVKPDRSGGSLLLAAPSVWAVVRRWGKVVYAGPVSAARPAALPDGELSLAGLRSWSGLIAARDPGAGGAVLGFALCALGGALSLGGRGREGSRA